MKKILTTTLLFLSLSIFSQETGYRFKLQNVNDLASAKQITDPLRDLFKVYPIFVDSLDMFVFTSKVNLTKQEVKTMLDKYNYNISYFNKIIRPEEINEEIKEK